MKSAEEYIRTHCDAILNTLLKCRNSSTEQDDITYYQHEINALIDVMRELPKQQTTSPQGD
jgi:hypothetical protein